MVFASQVFDKAAERNELITGSTKNLHVSGAAMAVLAVQNIVSAERDQRAFRALKKAASFSLRSRYGVGNFHVLRFAIDAPRYQQMGSRTNYPAHFSSGQCIDLFPHQKRSVVIFPQREC